MSDRLAEIRAAQIAQDETQPMWVRDLAADYCELLKKLALQEGYTRGWEERARKAESERDDLLARLAACEQERDEWRNEAKVQAALRTEELARLAAAEEALRMCVDALGELTEPDPQVYDAYESARSALAANTETPEQNAAGT